MTVGICEVFPPCRVNLVVDLRDTQLRRRDSKMWAIDAEMERIASKRQVSSHQEVVNADAPAECAPAIIEALSAFLRKARTQVYLHGQPGRTMTRFSCRAQPRRESCSSRAAMDIATAPTNTLLPMTSPAV